MSAMQHVVEDENENGGYDTPSKGLANYFS